MPDSPACADPLPNLDSHPVFARLPDADTGGAIGLDGAEGEIAFAWRFPPSTRLQTACVSRGCLPRALRHRALASAALTLRDLVPEAKLDGR